MKDTNLDQLNLNQMENINGGDFIDGFCAGAAIALLIAPNPAAGAVTVGCALYALR